jgi:PAS domain S-box-containing protein
MGSEGKISVKIADSAEAANDKNSALAQASSEAIILHEKGIFLDANDEAFRIFGYSPEDIIGKSVLQFVAEEYRDIVKKNISERVNYPYEAVAIKKDGSRFFCMVHGRDVSFKGRTIRAVNIRDMTDLKVKEEALKESYEYYRESEQKYKQLFENNLAGVFRTTLEGKFLKINTAFAKIFGYDSPEDLTRLSSKIVYFQDSDRDEYLVKLKKEGEVHNFPLRLKRRTGEVVWVLANSALLINQQKNEVYIEGTLIDITERVKQQEELEKSRESYRSLIEHSPDGVFIHDDSGNVIYANPSALKMIGIKSLEEMKVRSLFYYALPEYHAEIKARKEALERGENFPFTEGKIKRPDNTTIDVEFKPTLINFEGKKAVLVVYHNLSAARLLQAEQLRSQLAEETNKRLQVEIAERKKAEQRLIQSQKYARSLIDSSIDIIIATNSRGKITEFNLAAQKTYGYAPEEVLSKDVAVLFANPGQSVLVINEIIAGKGTFSGEIENIKKSGEKFTAYISASVLKNEKGEAIGAMGISRDITKAKAAERELELSEKKYKALFNQAYIGIGQVAINGRFLHANEQLCKMFGYTRKELMKKRFEDITHKDDIKKSLKLMDQLIDGGKENITFEKRYVHKNGSIIYASLTSSLVRDQKGKPDYFVSVFHDITETKKINAQIEEQAAKLTAIIESSSHLIWTVDKNHRFTSFNKNFADAVKATYGITPFIGMSEVEGKMISTEEANRLWMKRTKEAFKGRPQHFEIRIADKKGKIHWREIYLNPIYSGKKIKEISGIGHDITEKKEAEERIRQSLKEKEVLLKEVHHRVKNNLQVISSILNLQSSYVKDQKTLQILKESQNRIKSMSFIHESLYQTTDFTSINFSDYVRNLSQNLIQSYSGFENKIELRLDIDDVFLNLDMAIPCGLIINELVSNSLKYAFPQKAKGQIFISVKKQKEKISLIISDNGVGLSKKIDYRNTQSLGLQLVVTLVEQVEGTIKMETGKGTRFAISLTDKP